MRNYNLNSIKYVDFSYYYLRVHVLNQQLESSLAS